VLVAGIVGKPTNAAAEITPTASITKAPITPTRSFRPLPHRRPPVPLTYSSGADDPVLLMVFPLPVCYLSVALAITSACRKWGEVRRV
jgi:hypothetical protein